MAEHRDFQDMQYAFAAHLRDPAHAPAPEGIEDRRLAVYRSLKHIYAQAIDDESGRTLAHASSREKAIKEA